MAIQTGVKDGDVVEEEYKLMKQLSQEYPAKIRINPEAVLQ